MCGAQNDGIQFNLILVTCFLLNISKDLLEKVSETIENDLYDYFDRIKAIINLASEHAGTHQLDDYHAIFSLLDEESMKAFQKVQEIENIVIMLRNSMGGSRDRTRLQASVPE